MNQVKAPSQEKRISYMRIDHKSVQTVVSGKLSTDMNTIVNVTEDLQISLLHIMDTFCNEQRLNTIFCKLVLSNQNEDVHLIRIKKRNIYHGKYF